MATRPTPSIPTTRTITVAEATAHLSTVVDAVSAGDGDVILERDGMPKAAVISMDEYRQLIAARDEDRKRQKAEALRWLREFQESYDGRNDDLTEEEAMELAVRATKETRAELWDEAQQRLRDAEAQRDS